MIKRPKILTIAGFTLTAGSVLWTISFSLMNASQHWDDAKISRVKTLSMVGREAFGRFERDHEQSALDRLHLAFASEDIDYYMVEKNGSQLTSETRTKGPWEISNPERVDKIFVYDKEEDNPKIAYVIHQIGPYRFTTGTLMSGYELFKNEIWKGVKLPVLVSLGGLVGLILLGLRISLRDFKLLAREASGPSRGSYLGISQLSHESFVLAQGHRTLESEGERAKQTVTAYGTQILSAIKTELDSKKRPPYDVDFVVARVDINSYTSLHRKFQHDFLKGVDDFFLEAAVTVERYGGLIYQYVGDEVIYHFNAGRTSNPAAMALSAVRDLNELAASLSAETEPRFGYSLVIKASICAGSASFRGINGFYRFAGTPLNEGARLIGAIHERKPGIIYMSEAVAMSVQSICSHRLVDEVELKGLGTKQKIFEVSDFVSLSEVLLGADELQWGNVGNYRNDRAVSQTLLFVLDKREGLADRGIAQITRHLREFRISKTSSDIRETYYNILVSLRSRFEKDNASEVAGRLQRAEQSGLSLAISLARNLLAPSDFDDKFCRFFLECLEYDVPRVTANALDVFKEFDPANKSDAFKRLAASKHNRVLANLHLKESIAGGVSKDIARRQLRMLSSSNVYDVASAIWAIGELVRFYKDSRPTYLATNQDFQRVIEKAMSFNASENEMVSRHAKALVLEMELIRNRDAA